MGRPRAACDAIDEMAWLWSGGEAESEATAPARVEFVLLDERVYAAFADAAHGRWGKQSGRREG